MSEIALRIFVAMAAGATIRMLGVLDLLPLVGTIGLMALAGGVLSYGLKTPRLFVALGVALSYFITVLFTKMPVGDAGAAVNPSNWTLIENGIGVFVPFAMPALGSWIALRIESRRQSDQEEITEESLLKEKLPPPPSPQDLAYYDLKDSDL